MVSLSFARDYAYAYWISIGLLLAVVVPLQPSFVGPESPLGLLLHMFPDTELDTTTLWFSHCWGVAMLSMIVGHYLTPGSDFQFVRTMAVVTMAYYPVCYYAWVNDFGYFWRVFFPVIHSMNAYIYVSAGFLGDGKKLVSKKK